MHSFCFSTSALGQKPVSDVGMPSGVYTLLAEGRLEATHPHHPAMTGRIPNMPALDLPGGLELQSVYSAGDGSEPIITTRVPGFDGTLDYIWVRSGQGWHRMCSMCAREQASRMSSCAPNWLKGPPVPLYVSSSTRSRNHWNINALLDLPFDSTSVSDFPSIPNEDFPSDHLAVGSSVELIT